MRKEIPFVVLAALAGNTAEAQEPEREVFDTEKTAQEGARVDQNEKENGTKKGERERPRELEKTMAEIQEQRVKENTKKALDILKELRINVEKFTVNTAGEQETVSFTATKKGVYTDWNITIYENGVVNVQSGRSGRQFQFPGEEEAFKQSMKKRFRPFRAVRKEARTKAARAEREQRRMQKEEQKAAERKRRSHSPPPKKRKKKQ